MRRLAAIVVLATVGFIGADAAPARADTASDEAAFVVKINGLRASRGVGQLTVDGGLTSIARDWAQQMANAGEISHNGGLQDLVTSNWSQLGENVGMGPAVDSVFAAFVASPKHYDNLVDPSFTHVGVGVVWSGRMLFTSHQFMTLRGGAVAPPPPPPPASIATPRPAPVPRPVVTTVPRPVTTTTAPPPPPPSTPPPPPPPPEVPDRVRMVMEALRGFDPVR